MGKILNICRSPFEKTTTESLLRLNTLCQNFTAGNWAKLSSSECGIGTQGDVESICEMLLKIPPLHPKDIENIDALIAQKNNRDFFIWRYYLGVVSEQKEFKYILAFFSPKYKLLSQSAQATPTLPIL